MFSKSPRKIRNLIVNPLFQFKLVFQIMTLMLAMFGCALALLSWRIEEIRLFLSSDPTVSFLTTEKVNVMIYNLTNTALFVFIAFALICLIYGIIISHRIAGPMVALLHYINDLKAGNYDSNRQLRRYDELKPIMQGLHELAVELKNRQSRS